MDTTSTLEPIAGPASDAEPEVDQPGLSQLRAAVATQSRRLPRLPKMPGGKALQQDGLAGLNSAVSSVPDGMASGLLAGVNPIYGLYACMVGPIVGAVFSNTPVMGV